MNRRVLFVEDEDLLRTIYRRQAQAAFEVDVAAGSHEALAALSARSYAVVVTDRSMPDIDGLELAMMVRRLAPRSVLILLSASAHDQPTEIVPGLLFRVLAKPCPRDVLLESLEQAVALYGRDECLATVESAGCLPG